MPKYGGKQNFSLRSFPEVGEKQDIEQKKNKENREIWVAHVAVTERWPKKVEKNLRELGHTKLVKKVSWSRGV